MKSQADFDFAMDFNTLSNTSKLVRIYAASDCNTLQEMAVGF
jgi:exo-beta-1,3-glucanase (GH17 family)